MLTHPEPLKSLLGFQFLCLVSLRVSISGSYAWVPPHVNPKHVPPGLRYLLRSSKFTLVALLFSSRRQSLNADSVLEPIKPAQERKENENVVKMR